MASADAELVRAIYEPWSRGDFSSSDWADPDIQFVVADGTEPSAESGLDAMEGAWRNVMMVWDDLRAYAEDVRELPDGRILVLTRNQGRGKASGVELESVHPRGANVFTIRDGRVVCLAIYWDRDNALGELDLPSV